MSETITLESPSEGVALVTMTNPEIANRGSFEAIARLASALKEAREGGARVAVLASGLEGHWLEHAWLRDLANLVEGKPTSGGDALCWFNAVNEITSEDWVTIAAISGDCSGGGAELGWACDLRVAEEQAHFSQPEVLMGLATGLGGTSRLMHLIGRTATAEMVLDGRPLTAARLYELRGVNRVVARGAAVEESLQWAARLAKRPHASLTALKKMLKNAENLPLNEALSSEQQLFQALALTPEGAKTMARVQAALDRGEALEAGS